jgi:hypothetical protein
MGGTVVIRPDTAITHVIYDGRSAALLARELGLDTLSELPEGTVCVKWDWVVKCKMAVSTTLSFFDSDCETMMADLSFGTEQGARDGTVAQFPEDRIQSRVLLKRGDTGGKQDARHHNRSPKRSKYQHHQVSPRAGFAMYL